jgi:hypothetical protein
LPKIEIVIIDLLKRFNGFRVKPGIKKTVNSWQTFRQSAGISSTLENPLELQVNCVAIGICNLINGWPAKKIPK